jgi:hypothetical protein
MKPPVIVVAVDDSAHVEAGSNSFIMLGRMCGRLKMPGLHALSAVWSLTFVRHDRQVAKQLNFEPSMLGLTTTVSDN